MTASLPSVDLLALIERDTPLRKVAVDHNDREEFAGPCPFCKEGRDRFRVWPNASRPHWWCRRCERHGDAVDYLRERDGLNFKRAVEALGGTLDTSRTAPALPRPEPVTRDADPPPEAWQTSARAFLEWSQRELWSGRAALALAYLQDERGLRDETIRKAGLGFNPTDLYRDPARWGLDPQEGKVFIPRGVVIPCEVAGVLWYTKIRRLDAGEPKYRNIRGGVRALYGADSLAARRVALAVEGEFDCLLAQQEAPASLAVITLGSASGEPSTRWIVPLLGIRRLHVATDRDEAGEKCAAMWRRLHGSARIASLPHGKDVTEAHKSDVNLRAWLAALVQPDPPPATNADPSNNVLHLVPDPNEAAEAAGASEPWSEGLPEDMVAFIRDRVQRCHALEAAA